MATKALQSRGKKSFDDYPDVVNITEMCELLGICNKTGYQLLHDGTISSIKIGNSYRIPKTFILRFLGVTT